MSSYIINKVARGTISKHAAAYEPMDPHRENYTDASGRTRSRKRKMPAGLSKKDERILRSVRRRAHYLDKGFSLCGFKFGWTAIFGLIPLAGDVVGFLLSYMLVLRKCREADLPLILQQRMAFNQAVSLGVGLIPLAGDILLAVWKANSRNAALLEDFLIQRAAQTAANAQSTTATGKTQAQLDNEAATAAMHAPGIDRFTGERKGTPYEISPEVLAEEEIQKGVATGMASGSQPAGSTAPVKRGWYGWGGKADPAAQ